MRAALLPLVVLGLLAALVGSAPAAAGQPTQVVESAVNDILDVLRGSGANLGPAEEERIFNRVESVFDLRLFSRRTLGRDWNKLSAAQQDEFVDLYSQLLKNTYIERVQAYSDEKVRMDDEVDLGRDKAEVRTTVVGSGTNIPIFYRLYQKDGTWKVYDVLVEGVSLVNNYRSQFSQILSGGTPEELLGKLRQKVS